MLTKTVRPSTYKMDASCKEHEKGIRNLEDKVQKPKRMSLISAKSNAYLNQIYRYDGMTGAAGTDILGP